MLKIFLGNMGGVIYHPPTYFDNQYEDEWITDPLTKEMVKDVDQSEVISSRLIDSPVLGPVSVKELSGGVKTLILLAFDKNQKIFNISVCGNNCAKPGSTSIILQENHLFDWNFKIPALFCTVLFFDFTLILH